MLKEVMFINNNVSRTIAFLHTTYRCIFVKNKFTQVSGLGKCESKFWAARCSRLLNFFLRIRTRLKIMPISSYPFLRWQIWSWNSNRIAIKCLREKKMAE